jgi:hypothetical protein
MRPPLELFCRQPLEMLARRCGFVRELREQHIDSRHQQISRPGS